MSRPLGTAYGYLTHAIRDLLEAEKLPADSTMRAAFIAMARERIALADAQLVKEQEGALVSQE